jgi:hypothetical protein
MAEKKRTLSIPAALTFVLSLALTVAVLGATQPGGRETPCLR